MIKVSFILFFVHFLCHFHVFSQSNSDKSHYLGTSIQVYPAGVISSIHTEYFRNLNSSVYFRIGGNFANRKDFSPYNENEKGNGFGFTGAYRKHIIAGKSNLLIGMNIDMWNMWINWKNNIGKTNMSSGRTYTLVFQPWLEGGYFMPINKSQWQIGLTTGFGREINIVTLGKGVGQGWMNSLLLYFQYRL